MLDGSPHSGGSHPPQAERGKMNDQHLPHLPGCPCQECQSRIIRCFAVGGYLGDGRWARRLQGSLPLLPYRALPKYLGQ